MRAAALALVAGLLLGCNEEATFTIGREKNICEGNVPTACSVTGRCVLDQDHYIGGNFPGSRNFVVRTEGDALMKFKILLLERKTPGTELRIIVHEPSCADRVMYDSGGQDLFRLTGADGVIEIPLHVTRGGDHLVEVFSDAYCEYVLKVDV